MNGGYKCPLRNKKTRRKYDTHTHTHTHTYYTDFFQMDHIVLMRLYLVLTSSQGGFVILIEILYEHNFFMIFRRRKEKPSETRQDDTSGLILTQTVSNSFSKTLQTVVQQIFSTHFAVFFSIRPLLWIMTVSLFTPITACCHPPHRVHQNLFIIPPSTSQTLNRHQERSGASPR